MRQERDSFLYALLTEVAKVLLILMLILSVQYFRASHEPDDLSPRAPSRAEHGMR